MTTFPFSLDTACITPKVSLSSEGIPREIIKVPECIDWKDKIPHNERQEVDEHPANIRPSSRGNDD
jgi:hypothetical protein